MEQTIECHESLPKAQRYQLFLQDYRLLIEGETDELALLANTAAALHDAFGFFWVGFYLVKDEQWLSLGPFQGPVACTRIKHGRGVCGTAWAEERTLVVPDVDAFPGHIACSSLSRSEIVVPICLTHNETHHIYGVLDIDSTRLHDFDEDDRLGLEAVVEVLANALAAC